MIRQNPISFTDCPEHIQVFATSVIDGSRYIVTELGILKVGKLSGQVTMMGGRYRLEKADKLKREMTPEEIQQALSVDIRTPEAYNEYVLGRGRATNRRL